ncbi:hypothetical protein MAR_025619 [Mya arenaria]|uniref:Uncharacterized protein n=1 Tax=Mya arenaria TaxID=6604 RepID=A0ABY7ER72_MYAAR|nr:hypothetical protein MAR_025619 [Mya arenaria]
MKHTNDRKVYERKLKELLEESRALYSRNHIPNEDLPEFPPVPQKPDKKVLEQISETDHIVGCGDRFGTLLVLIDEEVEDRVNIEGKLISKLKDLGFEDGDLDFKYVPRGLQYFVKVKSGDIINCSDANSFGTLAGFAYQDENGTDDNKKIK